MAVLTGEFISRWKALELHQLDDLVYARLERGEGEIRGRGEYAYRPSVVNAVLRLGIAET